MKPGLLKVTVLLQTLADIQTSKERDMQRRTHKNIYILTHVHKKTPTNLNVHRKDIMPYTVVLYREVFCRVGESHLVDFE